MAELLQNTSNLTQGTRQRDLISGYLFFVLGIAFLYIKEIKNIKGIYIFNNILLYSAYTDDATFFVND